MKTLATTALLPTKNPGEKLFVLVAGVFALAWLVFIAAVAAWVYGQHGFVAAGGSIVGIHAVLASGFVFIGYSTLGEATLPAILPTPARQPLTA